MTFKLLHMYRVKQTQTTAATVTKRGGVNYTKRRGLQCMARLVWEAERAKRNFVSQVMVKGEKSFDQDLHMVRVRYGGAISVAVGGHDQISARALKVSGR